MVNLKFSIGVYDFSTIPFAQNNPSPLNVATFSMHENVSPLYPVELESYTVTLHPFLPKCFSLLYVLGNPFFSL